MTREDAKRQLTVVEPDFLEEAKTKVNGRKTWICPVCHNGSGSDGSGIAFNKASKAELPHWKCFVCGLYADVIELYKLHFGLTTDKEAFDGVYSYYGYFVDEPQSGHTHTQSAAAAASRDNTPPRQNPPQSGAQSAIVAKDYSSYYVECRNRLVLQSPGAISYLQARGISIETAARYNIGFDDNWRSPTALADGKTPPASPRIILPTCASHYVARDIRPNANKKFAKMNEGATEIFNLSTLLGNPPEAVFVTEGFFDALSIIEIGESAIALNSTSTVNKLLDFLREHHPNTTLILCLDNDKGGKDATAALEAGLRRLNIRYVNADITNGHKDPNEALQADRIRFAEIIAEVKKLSAKPDNMSSYIELFMSREILELREGRIESTGFKNFDEKTGGLYAGLYVIAAGSSIGKTTFCTQLADQLAIAGNDVLFFSMEQSRLEIVSKSLARITAQEDISTAANSLQIRQWHFKKEDPDRKKERVLNAAEAYKKDIGDRLSVIEGNFDCNISYIGDYIRGYTAKTGKRPVVFVDYLQILQPEQDRNGRTQTTKETIDNVITELKRISRELKLTVIVISSINRAAYYTDFAMESLKESGNVEFTADVIIGLQLQCMNNKIFNSPPTADLGKKKKIIDAAKEESPRKIELKCVKNRYGIATFKTYYNYYPAHDLFTEGVYSYEEPEEPKKAGRKL